VERGEEEDIVLENCRELRVRVEKSNRREFLWLVEAKVTNGV